MNDKYNTYDDKQFKYDYPITWKKRNISYLEKYHDTKIIKSNKHVIPTQVVESNDKGDN